MAWQRNLTQNRQHVQVISEILTSNRGFRGWVIEWYQSWPERTVIIKQQILM